MRRLLALLLVLGLAPGTWLRQSPPLADEAMVVRFEELRLPLEAQLAPHLGSFALEAVWRLDSPHHRFGGYSALLALADGRLLAISDRGYLLRFSAPGEARLRPWIGPIRPDIAQQKSLFDAEAATLDAASGRVWIAWEYSNSISRHGLDFGAWQRVRPRPMRKWSANSGPEAMVRLADGRFVVLCEGFAGLADDRTHRGLIFAGDPLVAKRPRPFAFSGPPGFSPTDMAQLPDGRVLILMRRFVWPLPARFVGRIVLADPDELRADGTWRGQVVARLSSSLPVDNFEGLAITPRGDGRVTVWLISDDNGAVSQRTLLWKLAVDPARLPGARKKARESSARPSTRQH